MILPAGESSLRLWSRLCLLLLKSESILTWVISQFRDQHWPPLFPVSLPVLWQFYPVVIFTTLPWPLPFTLLKFLARLSVAMILLLNPAHCSPLLAWESTYLYEHVRGEQRNPKVICDEVSPEGERRPVPHEPVAQPDGEQVCCSQEKRGEVGVQEEPSSDSGIWRGTRTIERDNYKGCDKVLLEYSKARYAEHTEGVRGSLPGFAH